MDLGVGPFTCQRRPDDDRKTTELYDEMVELAILAEEVGLDSVWVSEHHFSEDGYLSGIVPSLGALSQATDEIEFGSCIALAPFYDSLRLAEDAATVQLLSDDRLTLGLGIGYRDEEFEAFGVPKSERAARTEDAIRLMEGAWSDGPIGYDAEFHPVSPETTVMPKPASAPRVVLGGSAKPAVRRAARMTDGWLASPTLEPNGVETRRRDIEAVRAEADLGAEFTVYPGSWGFVADSTDEAWEALAEPYRYLQQQYEHFGLYEQPTKPEADHRPDSGVVFGDPTEVVEELEAYADSAGENAHFVFRVFPPGIDYDAARRCLELLGDEVAPQLR